MQPDGLDPSEAYFLVLHWLSNGPCREAAAALLREVEQHGLLPRTHAVTGSSRPTPYQQLLQQHSRVRPAGLLQLLQQSLQQVQQSGYAGAEGLSTLLAEGPLAALPSLQQLPAHSRPSTWWHRPSKGPTLPQQLLLREAGLHRASSSGSCRLPLRTAAVRFSHHATFRGHGFPVFCMLFDKQGSRVVTGADDAVIKIWSVETGLLLASARGHTGEITDLSLSCDGRMLASCATDGEVRIWSMTDPNLGQNLAVLRGHRGLVNLIRFHPRIPTALLSASGDGTLRLWDASDQHFAPFVLGPAQHAEPPAAAAAAEQEQEHTQGRGAAAGGAAAAAGAADVAGDADAGSAGLAAVSNRVEMIAEDDMSAMWSCAWSPCGTLIVAGSRDCNTYVWQWAPNPQQQQQQQQQPAQPVSLASKQQQPLQQQAVCLSPPAQQQQQQQGPGPCAGLELLHATDWPQPMQVATLAGHTKGVWQVEFSHAGDMLATSSLDGGTVMVWKCSTQQSQAGALQWRKAGPLLRLLPLSGDDDGAPSPAPKQKQRRPQPEQSISVHRILWLADDSKLLAVGSDNAIRVWSTHDWSLVMLLRGHSGAVHVLAGHPFDPRLVLSAGQDGLSILWDTATGTELQRFSSADTPPLSRGSWAPPVIQVVEGCFSPDGMSFVVTDVAGQLSLYSLGSPTSLLLSAPHDQFFSRDYDPIAHDMAGFAAYTDPDTGAVIGPVWQGSRRCGVAQGPALQQLLCDNHFRPYPEGFQAAYRAGRVLEYVKSGEGGMCLRGSSMTLPPSLEQWPPTVTAAVWKALEDRSELAARSRSMPSEEATREAAERSALEQHNRLLAALSRGMTLEEEALHVAQLQSAASAARGAAGVGQQQEHQQGTGDAEEQAAAAAAGGQLQQQAAVGRAGTLTARSGGRHRQPGVLAAEYITEEEALQELFDEHDFGTVLDNSDSDYSASGQQGASSDEDLNGFCSDDGGSDGGFSSGGADGGNGRRRRSQRRALRRRREAAAVAAAAAGGSHNLRPRRQRGASSQPEEETHGMATRSRAHTYNTGAQDSQDSDLQEQRTRQSKRRARDSTTPEGDGASSSDDEDYAEQQRRRRTRRRLLDPAGRHAATAAADGGRSSRHQQRGAEENAGHDARAEPDAAAAVATAAAALAAGDVDAYMAAWRPRCSYSWLSSDRQTPGVYVPQLGDAVVYLWEAHRDFLDSVASMQDTRPWECFQQLGLAAVQQQQQPGQQEQEQQQQECKHGLAHVQQQGQEQQGQEQQGQDQQQQQQRHPQQGQLQLECEQEQRQKQEQQQQQRQQEQQQEQEQDRIQHLQQEQQQQQQNGLSQPFQLHPAEPCVVVGLDYVCLPDDHTAACLTLQLADPAALAGAGVAAAAAMAAGSACATVDAATAAAAAQGCFQVVLPPPALSNRAWVTLQSTFMAGAAGAGRKVGDRVQAWCGASLQAGREASWWLGTVIAVLPDPTSANQHPGCDMYSSSTGQRCLVQWDSQASNCRLQDTDAVAGTATEAVAAARAAGTAPELVATAAAEGADSVAGQLAEQSSWHYCWELVAAGTSSEDALAGQHSAGLADEQVAQMQQTISKLRTKQYKFFDAPPSPDARFAAQSKVRAYNRIIPLPLGLKNIQARLTCGYYRSLQALLHDAALIANNAAAFNGPESPFATKAMQMYMALSAAAYPHADHHHQQQQHGHADWVGAADGSSVQWHQQQGVLPEDAAAAAAAAGAAAAAAACGGYGFGVGQDGFPLHAAAAGAWDGQWQVEPGAYYAAGTLPQQQQQELGEAPHAAAGELQQQQRPRLRLRLRGADQAGHAAAAAAGASGSRPQRQSGRHPRQQQEQVQMQRSRRPAAQRARAFMADYAVVERLEADSSDSQQGSDANNDSEGSGGGERGRGGSRRQQGRLTRHSARLQQQQEHTGTRQRYRRLAEGSESESDGL